MKIIILILLMPTVFTSLYLTDKYVESVVDAWFYGNITAYIVTAALFYILS